MNNQLFRVGLTSTLLCLVTLWAWTSCASAAGFLPIPSWSPDAREREHLRRSLTLMQSSTPEARHTVRVLFYGQSITEQNWWREVENYLRATYTNANLIIENRAIGGHAAQLLVKTGESDLYPFQPDLLIFHVYGSHTEYEKIIQRVKERTCADILLQTDHVTKDEALSEETDPANLTPKQWDAWMNHSFLPATAAKYGACRADVHELWKQYLTTNHLKASDLLKDGVHLNPTGEWLMAELLKRYLAPLPPKPDYDPMNNERVRTQRFASSGNVTRLEFTGFRVDVLFRPGASPAGLLVEIDGMRPSAIPALYGFTRVSTFPNSNWPLLLKVDSEAPLLQEDWTLKIIEAAGDGKFCRFSLSGSVTGEDGQGTSTNRFVSKSRRIVLEPADWNLEFCAKVFKRPLPDKYVASWKSVLRGSDNPMAPKVEAGLEPCVTLAQSLPNEKHVLLIKGKDLSQALAGVRIYH